MDRGRRRGSSCSNRRRNANSEKAKPKLSGFSASKRPVLDVEVEDECDAYEEEDHEDDTKTATIQDPDKTQPAPKDVLKVDMQILHMTEASQKMVQDMVKELHGDHRSKMVDSSFYRDSGKALGRFRVEDRQLLVRGVVKSDSRPKSFAQERLARYGFHLSRCQEALDSCDQEFGSALEKLCFECFQMEPKDEEREPDESKSDELVALESIYGDGFRQKIKAKLYELQLGLNRRGRSILFFVKSEGGEVAEDRSFTLEIRFYEGSRYPFDPPLVLISTATDFPASTCLRLSVRLMAEAKRLAEQGLPSIFSLVNLLEDEAEMTKAAAAGGVLGHSFARELVPRGGGGSGKVPSKAPWKGRREAAPVDVASMMKVNKMILERERQTDTEMMVRRRTLPAWREKDRIVAAVKKSQVLVISGATGCGKSTQVPQYILDDWLDRPKQDVCNVICTQPRRISAVGVAERVAAERGERVGQGLVGYQIRLESKTCSTTRLLFCTTGILLRRLASDPDLNSVSHIIVDEVHERAQDCDFLLMLLKDLLSRRSNLRIILMSATLDSRTFAEYFSSRTPTIDIPGKAFPVEQIFLEEIASLVGRTVDEGRGRGSSSSTVDIDYDLVQSVLAFIADESLHSYPNKGSILVFLPGMQEITTLRDRIAAHPVLGSKGQFVTVPLHSSLSSEEQSLVFQKTRARKIVLSTNLAETSITIDDCIFVVDVGHMKEKGFDAVRGMESLDTVWVSRANALQRKGRAGRVMPGVCFHLYTKAAYDRLRPHPTPEMKRVPLDQMVLHVKTLVPKKRPEAVIAGLIDPPAKTSVQAAIQRLQEVGALDSSKDLTPLGFHLSGLPVDIRIGKLLLFGAILRCSDSALTIAAALSYRSPFVSPMGQREEASDKKASFAARNSDSLAILRAYNAWMEEVKKGSGLGFAFAKENFLSVKTLQMMSSLKRQLANQLVAIGFAGPEQDLNENCNNYKIVACALAAALYPNIVQVLSPDVRYKQTSVGAVVRPHNPEDLKFRTKKDGYVRIHPSSVTFKTGSFQTPYLTYHEKLRTSRVFVREVSMVPVYPLILFGGSGVHLELQRGRFVLSLEGGWIKFVANSHLVAECLKATRSEVDALLEEKIRNPGLDLQSDPRGKLVIDTLVKLLNSE